MVAVDVALLQCHLLKLAVTAVQGSGMGRKDTVPEVFLEVPRPLAVIEQVSL